MPSDFPQNDLKDHLQSIEWLKDLFNHAHDLIQIVAIDGTMMYVNKSWSTLLEYEQEEILGNPIQSFIHESDRQRYTDYRADVIDEIITDTPIIFNLQTKSAKKVAVEGVVSVKIENGKPLYTRGIFREITERIENEHALKRINSKLTEREYNLQQLLTYAPDAIIVTDNQSRITYWNPKAEEIFGWTAAEVSGRTLSETIIPEQYREAHEAGMKRYLSTGEIRDSISL
jgi:PAS domain S-box-containing protein